MRFVKGLVGSWLGLGCGMALIGVLNGTLNSITAEPINFLVINMIFAAIGTTVIVFAEKASWNATRYIAVGAAATGGALLLFLLVFLASLSPVIGSITLVGVAIAAASSLFVGAVSGVGYRLLAGSLDMDK